MHPYGTVAGPLAKLSRVFVPYKQALPGGSGPVSRRREWEDLHLPGELVISPEELLEAARQVEEALVPPQINWTLAMDVLRDHYDNDILKIIWDDAPDSKPK